MWKFSSVVCLVALAFLNAGDCSCQKKLSSIFIVYKPVSTGYVQCTLKFTDGISKFPRCRGGCSSQTRYDVAVNISDGETIPDSRVQCKGYSNCCNAVSQVSYTGAALLENCGSGWVSAPSDFRITLPSSCGCAPCYGTKSEIQTEGSSTTEEDLLTKYCEPVP